MKKILWLGLLVSVAVFVTRDMICGQAAPAPAAGAEQTLVLNTYGIWRFASELAPPVIADGTTAKMKHVWLSYKTPPVAADWMTPDFDDQFWNQGPVTLAPKAAMLSRVCLRGKFEVTNLAAVKPLTLSVGYHGGLVVYVNGKEVKREHLEAGKDLADGPAGEDRNLTGLAIPKSLLRKGINVIGLEVVRAPYAQETPDMVYEDNACQILSAQLIAPDPAGLVPSATRPQGLQVWNTDAMATDFDVDFGNPSEPLRPVVIVGAKNGRFTGKVMVGSTNPIKGLKVIAGDLKGQGGTIPAASVEFRYGLPWGEYRQVDAGNRRFPSPYATSATRLGALAKAPLAEFPVLKPDGDSRGIRPDAAEGRSAPGAVVPLWIRVNVPANVGSGVYTGAVTVNAQGEKPVNVPMVVRVADWQLPSTDGMHTFVDLIQCPDTLALEYNVPLWSEKHWELIAESFRLIGETGCRTLYVPLIAHTNLGNEESMVRWVKKADGKYDYDFSIMERYIDVATKNMGKPKVIIFNVWDVYMIPPKDADTEEKIRSRQKQMAEYVEKTAGDIGRGPMVTLLDPATQKTELLNLPTHFETEKSKALWKPLFDQIHARMKKRGLDDTLMLGLQGDAWASKHEHELFKEISGDLPWVIQSHEGSSIGQPQYGISKLGYQALVWVVTFSDDNSARPKGYRGGVESHMGWARTDLVAQFDRFSREASSTTYWSLIAESTITGSQRGNGRLGGDYWKVIKDKRGRRTGRSHERYPESTWRNLFIPEALLAPGPAGPVAADELEAYRNGIQECEARIVLEYALDRQRDKLGDDLAKRCQDYLANRHMLMWLSLSDLQLFYDQPGARWGPRYMAESWRVGCNIGGNAWYLGSGHQQRTEELFNLAGEVTRKIGPLPADVSKKDGKWPIHVRN